MPTEPRDDLADALAGLLAKYRAGVLSELEMAVLIEQVLEAYHQRLMVRSGGAK